MNDPHERAGALNYAPQKKARRCPGWLPDTIKLVLVVLAILVFVALLQPYTRPGSRTQARLVVCESNLREIGRCLLSYASAHNDRFPSGIQLVLSAEWGHAANELLTCPELPAGGASTYVYIPGQGAADDARNVLVYEPANSHDGKWANVLFADGHVQQMTAADLNAAIARTMANLAAKAATQPASPQPAP